MICCFIGHRKINDTRELRERLHNILQEMINIGTRRFIFGDHSEFDSLCYETVTKFKADFPDVERIHFRKDYAEADDYTMQFLLEGYEKSVCPEKAAKAGKASYLLRNFSMIDESDICVFYYDENYSPKSRASGTAKAYTYAMKREKKIVNVYEKPN